MTLAELLESKFRADTRFRGAAYLEAERVAITRVTPEQVHAVVRDGGEHQTLVSRLEDDLRLNCTCDLFLRTGSCKHLWGTVLAVDAGGFVHDATRPGYVPPFLVETESFRFDDDLWGDEADGLAEPDILRSPRKSRKIEVELRPWESRLKTLREDLSATSPAAGDPQREAEIFYEIDVDRSRSEGQLVIQTSHRQRRSSGQWGKLKALRLRAGKLDDIEHEDDRRILSFLSGGIADRDSRDARPAEFTGAIHRYKVPFDLATQILPRMCATGRLRFLTGERDGQAALAWDQDEPWELCVEVAFDEDEDSWTLRGQLRRDEEVRRLDELVLVIPGGLAIDRTHIAVMRDFGAFDWTRLLDRSNPVSVPQGDQQELVDQLLDMPVMPRLELPEELRLEEVHCEPVPYLTVRPPKSQRWHNDRLRGELTFDYLGSRISAASERWAIVQRDQGQCLVRNRSVEEQCWRRLQELGFQRLRDKRRGRHDVEIDSRRLGAAVRTLIDDGWQVRADDREIRQANSLQFRVESGIDWFELHADIDFDGARVAFPELLSALARGDTTVRLDDGSVGILPEEWLQRLGMFSGLGQADDEHIRFGNNQVALLDALLATQDSVNYDEKFEEVRRQLREFSGVQEQTEPRGFQGELRGYQRHGLGWLRFLQDFNFGGCLADDMGLGKTVQLLALLQERRVAGKQKHPSLVVVPKSLLFNWHQECTRFAPRLKVLEYTGLDRAAHRGDFDEYHVILTTYGTLRRDAVSLKDARFDYVVLDEAQTVKNPSSQVARASRLLQARHRVALTGTPIENHLGDLWSIFEFLNPGMLGRSTAFKTYSSNTDDQEAKKLLAQAVRPFILRRTKQEVASELPEKLEETIYCDLGEDQRRLYDELRVHYRNSLLGLIEDQGLAKSRMHVLEALLRLRQAACHPALLDRGSDDEPFAKLDYLCPHLEELIEEGHKALVFSQFTSMLAIVRKHLDERNVTYEYLDGQTRDRKARVERFQDDTECGVFLISLKAGGLGLNLTAADYVFLLDPWWNPAVEAQAIDRAHRVGQTRRVFAYRLICRDTVEEKIAELQTKKRSLADAILEADNTSVFKDLSSEDLELLLS